MESVLAGLLVGAALLLALAAFGWWVMARTTKPLGRAPAVGPAEYSRSAGIAAAPSPLSAVASWGYQLQHLDVERAAISPFDLLVVDYSKDGSDEGALDRNEVARLRTRPGGGRRHVLAYLSIGEAESYRFYWQRGWKRKPPAWLLSENPDWAENYAVAFWEPEWQRLMFGAPEAYLDRIIAAGFDGVYLDKCDVFEDLARREPEVAASRREPAADMVAFIRALSAHAKASRPGFLVVMQNAESLLDRPELIAALDGVAKEELYYGQAGGQAKNARQDVVWSQGQLDKAKAAGKAVLVVEYVSGEKRVSDVRRQAAERGYALAISDPDRELDRLDFDVPVA